jgi:hypothetical protein
MRVNNRSDIMITSIETFFDEQQYQLAKYIEQHFTRVKADALGLDIRAGYCVYVNDEAIAVSVDNVMQLDYYGGFEYVSSYARKELCGFVFYLSDDKRVQEAIDNWKESVDTDIEFA